MKAEKKMLLSVVLGFFIFSTAFAQGSLNKDKEKQQQINQNPSSYLKQGGQIETVPEFKTKAEKMKWFKANDKSFVDPNTSNFHATKSGNEPIREKKNQIGIDSSNDQNFPAYINTGNKQLDDDNYKTAKELWIYNNKAKYDKMIFKDNSSSETPAQIRARELKSNSNNN